MERVINKAETGSCIILGMEEEEEKKKKLYS
jgi:hypothetical protein